jgi:hypothetical protein
MEADLDEWEDEKAREYYLTVCNSGSDREKTKAIRGLGKLARSGSANASYALRLIARSAASTMDQSLATEELSKR